MDLQYKFVFLTFGNDKYIFTNKEKDILQNKPILASTEKVQL
jgi:hypothetical protein